MGSWSYEGPTASIFSVPTISNHNSEKKLQEFWLHQQHRIPANLFLSQKRFLSWNFRKRPSDFQGFPTIFRRLTNVSENLRRCSDELWAPPKPFERRQIQRVLKELRHKVNIKPLYEIFLWKLPELNFLYWSCVKCQFVRIYESGVGNCPWCVTSMPLIWSADM